MPIALPSRPDPASPAGGVSKAPPPPRNATLLEVVGAVFSSFLGIRKGAAMRKDAVTIRPQQVIAVAVVLVALFVVGLIFFVRAIVRSAGV
jgi:Protein of unknown function (DUF2970)